MIDSKATNPVIQTSDNRLKEDQDGDFVNDYDYDKNGNLILDADNQRYIFDAENRIKEFFKSTNQTSSPNAVYQYDGEGKRVRKISDSVETIFVYNAGGMLVAEYSTELNPEPQVSYLTADHLGSPRIITANDGTVISRHDYMAFGDEVTTKLGNVGGRTNGQGYGEPDDVRKQYTGYERDKESGLDYAQARYYSSDHGRFTSVDPLTASANVKDPQTFNRYTYAMNSPYKFTDPLGLISETTGACGKRCRNSNSGEGGGGAFGAAANGGYDSGHRNGPQELEALRRHQAIDEALDKLLKSILAGSPVQETVHVQPTPRGGIPQFDWEPWEIKERTPDAVFKDWTWVSYKTGVTFKIWITDNFYPYETWTPKYNPYKFTIVYTVHDKLKGTTSDPKTVTGDLKENGIIMFNETIYEAPISQPVPSGGLEKPFSPPPLNAAIEINGRITIENGNSPQWSTFKAEIGPNVYVYFKELRRKTANMVDVQIINDP